MKRPYRNAYHANIFNTRGVHAMHLIIKSFNRMKYVLITFVLISLIWACSTPKGIVKVEKSEPVTAVDSVEYGVETFDAKFETWYEINKSPATYRSQSYYESWNRQYVSAWNYKANTMSRNSFFEPIIGYDPTEDYGFEVNHKMFYYFQYVENVLKIQIMPGGPKVITH